jgi:uncharacterized protein YciI
MAYFLCRLLPPRPSFIADMTTDERALMGAHAQYWGGFVASGEVIALGPVADPKGSWGLALMEMESDAAVRALQAKDPVIAAAHGFSYEVHPMPMLGLRGAQARAPVSSVTP